MKTTKKLFVALLAVAMIFVMAACSLIPGANEGDKYTVTFYNNGEVYKTVEVNPGDALTLPKAPKGESGKGLRGWSTIDGDVEEIIDPATFVVDKNVNLYAIWADVYTVVINADNGTAFTVLEKYAGECVEQPEDPVKEGFKFIEWRDALNETTFDFSQPIYADVTIKAMYGDGAPNRVTDTKWDFSTGIHGSWIGSMGGWQRVENGIPCEDMVYQTTEDGYAAWGFTLTDSLENIPVINGENGKGMGMKFLYNEGISVEASKAKLVVIYVKPKYYSLDITGNTNDQFRISILTSNGGMIYGYGTGSEDWTIRSDGGSKNLMQVDVMEDGWIRVQYKIHELKVWSEDAVLKSMSLSFVQRPSNPVMDIISLKSIELLDQEEFIDPHTVDYVTNNKWDMSKEEESSDWFGVMQNGSNTTSVTTTIDANGTQYVYGHANAWRAIVMNLAKIDMSKCSGTLSVTMDISGMSPTQYRLYLLTDAGGDLYKNSGRDDVSCYYITTSATEPAEGWTIIPNADGTITVTFDLTKLEYWKNGTELQGLSFVTVDSTTNGTVVYKSISLVDTVKVHNCETEGHIMKDATCDAPKTCAICGVTEGEANGHSWVDATCQAPKTCSVCGAKDGAVADHTFVEGVCSGCGIAEFTPVTQTKWELSNEEDAADWGAYVNKKQDPAEITAAVTSDGLKVDFIAENNWRAIILDNAAIDISKLTGKLTFTYSTDLTMTNYRIHLLTDLGGKLTANGTDNVNYVNVSIANIQAGSVAGWTHTVNDDGSYTVTVDLTTLSDFVNGTKLKGLTICTVSEKKANSTITYKSVELEKAPAEPKVWDMTSSEVVAQWYGVQNKNVTNTSTITTTETGSTIAYSAGNDWKGFRTDSADTNINELEGILSFTYSTDMTLGSYRVYILTDKGGNLEDNALSDKASYVSQINISAIAEGTGWARTENADGSVTVTFDLTTLSYWSEGTTLQGLTICTVTSGKPTGSVTYSNIEIR